MGLFHGRQATVRRPTLGVAGAALAQHLAALARAGSVRVRERKPKTAMRTVTSRPMAPIRSRIWADTKEGLDSVRAAAQLGVPYSVLLYERLLGRPFASHQDSVSELVGDIVKNAVEHEIAKHDVSGRKTAHAERLPGFDQAPDFVVPNAYNPKVVIDAKLSEDDGTARDKVTRIQHLAELSASGGTVPRFEVVACIAGRGFVERRENMRKLILATRGKVFTPRNIGHLVEHTGMKHFRSL